MAATPERPGALLARPSPRDTGLAPPRRSSRRRIGAAAVEWILAIGARNMRRIDIRGIIVISHGFLLKNEYNNRCNVLHQITTDL